MAANSRIEWCDHTFNPWRGCTKVSAGCANCYAETMSKRNPKALGVWGDGGTRVVASDAMWREPVKWNAAAEKAGEPALVFCASLADVCEDRNDLIEPRIRLKRLMEATPHLRWLLLSKRPENYLRLFYGPEWWPRNIWAGTSAENQECLDERAPHLLRVPAAVRFLSLEPLLGPIDIPPRFLGLCELQAGILGGIGWVIVGGESGAHARATNLLWIRYIVWQCKTTCVPCFVKQVGPKPYLCGGHTGGSTDHADCGGESPACRFIFRDRKGGDPSEWPIDLHVREFPK